MAHVSLKDVTFAYPNGFVAIDHINIEIEKGENVAIVGQNGAGKTTTVKMCNGLLRPTKGDVKIGDMNTKDYTTAQVSRKVGYVFQNPDDQIFHSSVYDEVVFGPKMMKLANEKVEKQVDYALKITGMDVFKNENPYNLPLSTRKFITIAAIIAMDTEVMIFDEPTAGQDLEGNRRLSAILKELHHQGKTVITISHDMEFVVSNFERVIVMANKKVVTSGPPKKIFWDFPALEEAMLKQPYISQLCNSLNLGEGIIHLEEAVKAIKDRS
ncbi:ABC transporter ATP-binding protein [Sporanaerobium hydrogeniformans]|uniref:ABC transporter ATP-binding protein n=1 Tax=Sporanaerobium hydrogeniformans TaxID=3072179 RepID=A0AC61D7N2_9FIRM|nr:ABC transporter ATP-binding protein [Sporanaerobium hydrogeniformans]PHV69534.1 ABC transporter ATP-binding protein [Sporanaerobium hydrogeniformans]